MKGFTCCRSGEAAVGRVVLETTKNAATAAAARIAIQEAAVDEMILEK